MALRLLEIAVPTHRESQVADVLRRHEFVSTWQLEASSSGAVFHVVLPAEATEPLMDDVEGACTGCPDLRMVLVPVEAAVPHVEAEGETAKPKQTTVTGVFSGWRVSREELHEDATDGAAVSPSFYILIALSAVVASVGLLRDSIAVIIGAMVIAPLFGPNMALAVGTSLGDMRLISRGLKALTLGLGVALGVSVVVGLFLPVDPEAPSLAARTEVSYADVILALAAGAAGAFAFTAGQARALTGVMVAVALLPPVAAFGLLVADGHMSAAGGAALLAAVNVICINLAGVGAFLLQGVRPRTWWEAERAKRASRRATAIWLILLVILVIILALM
jgi:uncharacterized hydrophobic protein (TIGR00341 family)